MTGLWVARGGLRLIALGTTAGLLAGWMLAGALEGLLFGVARTDAVTVVVVVASLAGVGLVQIHIPLALDFLRVFAPSRLGVFS